MRHLPICLASLTVLISTSFAGEPGYYAQPALHGDRLIFVSEGDLWSASVPSTSNDNDPIIAYRLTTGDGVESKPAISPDGRTLAFSAQYDGNTDVYIMPIDGGPPKRLTFHPAGDNVTGWLPDGSSVLFTSNRNHPHNRPELYRIATHGGMPVRYEFGDCSMASFTTTGKRFAFTRWSNETWTWKRYRGGTAPEVWLGDSSSGTFTPLTSDRGNDMFPMWVLDRPYFISDRTGTFNIFSDSPSSPGSDIKQHTQFGPMSENPTAIEGYDVRWPSADAKLRGTRIAFCQAGALALLDTKDNSIRRLNVQLASDRVAARQRFADLLETVTEFNLSPDGKTALIGSRGELMAIPVEIGPARQLTHTSSAREWGATYLNDSTIVMVSDQSGEQQIAMVAADGSNQPSLLTQDREDWLFPPAAAPDGKWIAFGDKTLRLHVMNVNTFERRMVDQSEAGEITDYRFSPDSQWLAYAKPMLNYCTQIHLYSVRTGKSYPLSTGMFNDTSPRWDPAGKYLYFLSDRRMDPRMGPLDFEHVVIESTEVFAVALAAGTPPPLKSVAKAAGFDFEKWAKPPEDETKKKDDGDADSEPAVGGQPADPNAPPPNAIQIDTDGLTTRICRIQKIEPGNYAKLEALHGAICYLENPVVGLLDDAWPYPPLGVPHAKLHRFDLVKEEGKVIAEKLSAYRVNTKATKIMYPLGEEKVTGFKVIAASGEGGGEADNKDAKNVEKVSAQLRIDVRAEWGQILAEAWRLQRDFYWAPNYVGLDWPAMRAKYEALLPRIGTRSELNDLIGQMIGELGTSHTYIWGGEDAKQPKSINVGLLGADIELDGRGFRIARIIPGQAWGEEEFISPLEAAHLAVQPGSYITAINGIALTPVMNPYDLLQNQGGKHVRLTITDPNGANTRTIEVKTLSNEQPLRYAAWVEANRRYVDEQSDGALGYLHIPDMGGPGLSMFVRYFYPQITKSGLVIDIRDNGGGFVSQMIVQRLARKVWAFMQPRHGVRERYPQKALHGHMAVIIDQYAGSDGDIFPMSFRMLGLGPLVGTRTWGGVVGIRADKPFVDMGLSTQPEFAWWEPSGGWSIENEGVSPDIEVDISPSDRLAGRDPQLDATIEYLMKKLEEEPMELPPPPPWPVRVK